MTPGLANKICIPSAAKVCCNFPETLKYLPKDKAVLTGSPIRAELLEGDRKAGLSYAHLTEDKPVLLIIGGSWICCCKHSGTKDPSTAFKYIPGNTYLRKRQSG